MSHCKLAHMWVFRAKDITDHHFDKSDLLSAWSKYLKYMYVILELNIYIHTHTWRYLLFSLSNSNSKHLNSSLWRDNYTYYEGRLPTLFVKG